MSPAPIILMLGGLAMIMMGSWGKFVADEYKSDIIAGEVKVHETTYTCKPKSP